MDAATMTKLRDLITQLEKLRRTKVPSDYAYGQRGRNENGRVGGKLGITAPGNDPDNPRLVFPIGEV
jgi:hypothetical protein